MNYTKITALALAVLALGACSSKKANDKLDYQSTNKKIVSLEIPPDLNDPRNGDLYSLPAGVRANPDALSEAAPSGSRVLTKVENARIERRGNQRWLAV